MKKHTKWLAALALVAQRRNHQEYIDGTEEENDD